MRSLIMLRCMSPEMASRQIRILIADGRFRSKSGHSARVATVPMRRN
jgi:hypothetical protein